MTKDEKNIKAVVAKGGIEKYSLAWFKKHGRRGGKKAAKKLGKQKLKERALKAWRTKKSKKK